jgi:hypothetical protein
VLSALHVNYPGNVSQSPLLQYPVALRLSRHDMVDYSDKSPRQERFVSRGFNAVYAGAKGKKSLAPPHFDHQAWTPRLRGQGGTAFGDEYKPEGCTEGTIGSLNNSIIVR